MSNPEPSARPADRVALPDNPTRCTSVAELIVDGKAVGYLRCSLDAGHDQARPCVLADGAPCPDHSHDEPGTPHRAALEWGNDDDAEVTLDAADSAAAFEAIDLGDDESEVPTQWPDSVPLPAGLCGVGGCVYLKGHELGTYYDDQGHAHREGSEQPANWGITADYIAGQARHSWERG